MNARDFGKTLTGPESILYEAVLDGQESGMQLAISLLEDLPPNLRTFEAALTGLRLALEAARKERAE